MIDFQNGTIFKLKKEENDTISQNVNDVLVSGETIIGKYKGLRGYVLFTDKRIIVFNIQGTATKKQEFISMPYKSINVFSVETPEILGIDGAIEVCFSGLGKARFEFIGTSDLIKIGELIGNYIL